MSTPRLAVAGPWITELERRYVSEAMETAWYAGAGTFVKRFERAFADAVQRRHAVSLPSCTAGIHLALLALGVGPGDEVIVPDATWIASSAPITYVGARPVFVDVDPITWCLDAAAFEAAISPSTKAVIPVDLYGGMPELDRIGEIAAGAGVAVIEDAAEAIGSTYGGRPAGSFGIASVFSFHGSKTVTTGEGGMIVTDDDDLHARISVLRDHGRVPGDTDFYNREVGQKYKMTDLQAALGLAQIERLHELVERKRAIFARYQIGLGDVPGVTMNAQPPSTRSSVWMVTVHLDPALGLTTDGVRRQLDEDGMDTRPFFRPLSSLPAYAAEPSTVGAPDRNPVSYALARCGLNLPSALNLTDDDVDRVCASVRHIVERARSSAHAP